MKGITVSDIIDDNVCPEDLDVHMTLTGAVVCAVVVGSIVYSTYSIAKLGYDWGKEGVKVAKDRYRRRKADRETTNH